MYHPAENSRCPDHDDEYQQVQGLVIMSQATSQPLGFP